MNTKMSLYESLGLRALCTNTRFGLCGMVQAREAGPIQANDFRDLSRLLPVSRPYRYRPSAAPIHYRSFYLPSSYSETFLSAKLCFA